MNIELIVAEKVDVSNEGDHVLVKCKNFSLYFMLEGNNHLTLDTHGDGLINVIHPNTKMIIDEKVAYTDSWSIDSESLTCHCKSFPAGFDLALCL